uniref:L1 transposable element RRM domain-containing protein n=1 Tax=Oreochromis niloticus TaxID=8128 RepID=A0A669E390_ORENI
MASYNLRYSKRKKTAKTSGHLHISATRNMADGKEELPINKLLNAIKETKEDLTNHIDKKTADIQTTLTKIESSLNALSEQVEEMEARVSANEDDIKDAHNRVDKMDKLTTQLKDKIDDLENRSRRSNLRILNIPEQAEGRDAVGFLEKFIPQILGNDNFTSHITLERAHRVGKKSDRPRPLIAKFLNFRDKEKVLRLARSRGEMTYENRKISFFPDYSADLQRRRDEFRDVKQRLREKEIEYALMYPAQLRVRHQGSIKIFSTPAEAQRYLKDLPNV